MARSPSKGAALLKAWRDSKGLSQADACVLVGLDPASYNGIESGRIKVGIHRGSAIEEGTAGAVPLRSWTEPASDKRRRAA